MDEKKPLVSVDRVVGKVHVAKVLPRQVLDELQIIEIQQDLQSLIDGGAKRLVLDFANVDHLSSSALGMLINLKRAIEARQGSLKLSYIRSQILKVLKITRLDEVISIHKTTDEAVAEFLKS